MSLLKEKSFLIPGPVGNIELKINFPPENTLLKGGMVIAHPHPQQGGTLDNKVVHTLARAALASGFAAVRFNFRGVGSSDGVYDRGIGEVDDMVCIIEYIISQYNYDKIVLAGFSFGGYVAAKTSEQVLSNALILVAPAVSRFELGVVPNHSLIMHGDQDDIVSLDAVLSWAEKQKIPVTVFPGTGHFFHGMLLPLQNFVRHYCDGIN